MLMPTRLMQINCKLSQYVSAVAAGVLAFLLVWGVLLGYYSYKFGLNVPPATSGDETSYDSVAWQMSLGNGFRLDLDDADFRAPYDRAAKTRPELFRLGTAQSGVITYRPPLFPTVISGTNLVFGRQFWAVRVFNSACMAACCGLLVFVLVRQFGVFPAGLAVVLFLAADVRTRLYGRAILTEALSAVIVACLAFVIFQYAKTQSKKTLFVTGVLTGIGILARNIFVLWIPGLLVILFVIRQKNKTEQMSFQRQAQQVAVWFLAPAILVPLPWMIRNCMVLESFKPMGTQGLTQLSAGFSDRTFSHFGAWQNLAQHNFFEGVVPPGASTLETELARAEFSKQQAVEWILHNPLKTVLLIPMKIYQEHRPYSLGEFFLFPLIVLGCWKTMRTTDGQILLGLIFTNAFAIGITWSVGGRFLVPLLFALHYFAAVGAWWLVTRSSDFRLDNKTTSTELSKLAMETTACPLCDSSEWSCVIQAPDVLYHVPGTFHVVRCKACQHVFLNPRPTLDEITKCYPADYGPHRPDENSSSPAEPVEEPSVSKSPWYLSRWARAIPGLRSIYYWLQKDYSHFIPNEAAEPKTALDIGCSAGNFLAKLREQGWEAEGVEIAEAPAKTAQERGFTVHEGTLESAAFEPERFNAVFAYMVLEHLHDPKSSLKEIHRVLADDGWLVFSVPNFACWERFVFGGYWRGLELPRHLQHYTPRRLKTLLAQTEFREIRVIHQRNVNNIIASLGLWLRDTFPRCQLGQSLINLTDRPTLTGNLLLAPISKFLAFTRQGGRLTVIAKKTS